MTRLLTGDTRSDRPDPSYPQLRESRRPPAHRADLATGGRVDTEALSRFPTDWGKAPDAYFAEVHDAELGHRLDCSPWHAP